MRPENRRGGDSQGSVPGVGKALPTRFVTATSVDASRVLAAIADVLATHESLRDQSDSGIAENYWPALYDAFRRLWATLPNDVGLITNGGMRDALRDVERYVGKQFLFFGLHDDGLPFPLVPLDRTSIDELRRLHTLVELAFPKGVENERHPEFVFAPSGDGYFIRGFGESGNISAKACKGLHQIFMLVQSPGLPVAMTDLMSAGEHRRDISQLRQRSRQVLPAEVQKGTSRQPSVTREGRDAIASELQRTNAELEAALNAGDAVEADICREHIKQVSATLRAMLGKGRRARDVNSVANKLRPSIRRALNRAYDNMRESKPPMRQLADHFEPLISAEGEGFVYEAANLPAWVLTESAGIQ